MPRLVTRAWNGITHTSIEYGPGRPAHLAAPLGGKPSSEDITQAEAALGITALVAEREKARGFYGS